MRLRAGPDFTVVDDGGDARHDALHVVADVKGVSPQGGYAAVMSWTNREAKASMSIYDPMSLLSRLNLLGNRN